MKIKLSKLLPNPYRDIGNYPIDKARVTKLQGSILNTEFWGGLVCRKHPTKKEFYQIAFGHHRVKALKDLKYTEIPMTVLDYTDAQMLQAMAEENREIGQHDIRIMTQTVEQVKKFLDGELGKYEYKDSNKFIRVLFESEHAYNQTKKKPEGAGQTTILKFLGKTWKQSEIQFALEVLKDETVDREAIESFKNRYQATQFKAAVIEAEIPVKKQKEVAREIKSKVSGGRAIRKEVFKHSSLSKPLPMLDDFVKDVGKRMSQLYKELVQIEKEFENIQDESNQISLYLSAKDLQTILTKILQRGKNEK